MHLRKRNDGSVFKIRVRLRASATLAASSVCLVIGAFVTAAFADDMPANQLRIVTSPVIQRDVSPDKVAEVVDPTRPAEATRPQVKMLLVSDGWVARDAIGNGQPLLDPVKQAPEQIPSHAQTLSPNPEKGAATPDAEPRSTFNFIVPETAAVAPHDEFLARTALTGETCGSESLASELYGPGAPLAKIIAKPDVKTTVKPQVDAVTPPMTEPAPDEAVSLSPPDPTNEDALADNEVSLDNPELTAPGDDVTDSGGSAEPMNIEELSGDEIALMPPSENADDVDIAKPEVKELTPMTVRDLKLRRDGSLNVEPPAKAIRAEPISSRNASRQSVGDETAQPLPPVTPPVPAGQLKTATDHLNEAGELILAIGSGEPPIRISGQTERLRNPIERTMNFYWNKPEDADTRTHWGMFHQLMIWDKDTVITHRNRKYNAVAWMAGNNQSRNQLLFKEDRRGIVVETGVGLQGHQAQMLAVFGLIDVPKTYPIYVGRSKFSVEDVVRREMLDCKSGTELTFTLIGLSHYIDTDSRWVASDGQDWDFSRLIQEELAQPVVGAACGGTHRLMGFAHALRRRHAEGKAITGQWERADRYVKDFIAYTWQLQNRDGSMSTDWFERSEDNGKMDRKIQTTGHMVEFLLTALPDNELQSPQMLRAISYLVNTLYQERGHEWQVGPKGHALRALAMYYRRVFSRRDPWRPIAVARQGVSQSR